MKIHMFRPTLFFGDRFTSFALLRNNRFYLNILINKHIYAVICIYVCYSFVKFITVWIIEQYSGSFATVRGILYVDW